MSEIQRVNDQLRRAYEGKAWHGPSVQEVLAGVTAGEAAARPVSGGHSIWEITLHVVAWKEIVRRLLTGEIMGEPPPEVDWPPITLTDETAWEKTLERLAESQRRLRDAVARFPDDRLDSVVPGKGYSAYFMLHGLAQHDAYHAGQIAVLKKAKH